MMSFLFSGQGRVSRKAIWLFYLSIIGASLVAAILDVALFGTDMDSADTGPVSAVLSLASIWPSIAVSAKRFHDRGMSGWWVLWFIILTGVALIPGLAMAYSQGISGEPSGIGVYVLLIGVAIPQIWQFVILMVQPGQPGVNKYGPNPLEPATANLEETFS